jgi:hypothetical protein
MNTFWLKIAGGVVVALVVLIVVAKFFSPEPGRNDSAAEPVVQEEPQEKTFADQVEEDKQNFSVPPHAAEPASVASTTPAASPQSAPVPTPQPRIIFVKPLNEFEELEAQRQLEAAVPGFSIGRLPMTGYNLAVDTCKRTISRWPDSIYAYQAKRILAAIPERFRERYKITDKLMDVSMFLQQRPGTQPVQLPPED